MSGFLEENFEWAGILTSGGDRWHCSAKSAMTQFGLPLQIIAQIELGIGMSKNAVYRNAVKAGQENCGKQKDLLKSHL